jgi:hypothetical protein
MEDILLRALIFGLIIYFLQGSKEGFQAESVGVIPPQINTFISKVMTLKPKESFQTFTEGFQTTLGATGPAPPVTSTTTTSIQGPQIIFPSCGDSDGLYLAVNSIMAANVQPTPKCLTINTYTKIGSSIMLGVLHGSSQTLYMYDINGKKIDFTSISLLTIYKTFKVPDADIKRLNLPAKYTHVAVALNPGIYMLLTELINQLSDTMIDKNTLLNSMDAIASKIPETIILKNNMFSTAAMIGIGVGCVAIIGIGIWAYTSRSSSSNSLIE